MDAMAMYVLHASSLELHDDMVSVFILPHHV